MTSCPSAKHTLPLLLLCLPAPFLLASSAIAASFLVALSCVLRIVASAVGLIGPAAADVGGGGSEIVDDFVKMRRVSEVICRESFGGPLLAFETMGTGCRFGAYMS